MAMISCPECTKEISDKAPACPNCGVPIAAAEAALTAAPSASTPPPGQEISYYSDEQGVRITSARAIIGTATYSMANISSVKSTFTNPSVGGFAVLLIGGLLFTGACGMRGDVGWAVMMGLAAAGGLLGLIRSKATYHVRLAAAGGEVDALSSKNKAYVVGVVKALNEAIVKRG